MARAVILLAVMATAALAACGEDGPADSAPVTFQVQADGAEAKVYERLVTGFEKATGRRVRFTPTGDRKEYLQKLTTSFAAGRAPDVFVVNHRVLGGYLARIEPARLERRDDYVRVALDAFTVGGTLQCVPQNASSLVVYVNEERFREAGLPVPSRPWSYEAFLGAARKLQAEAGADEHAVGVEPSVIRAAPFVWSAGGELVDDPSDPTRFTLDEPAGRRGLEALLRLRTEGLAPSFEEARALALDERFLAGKLAMYLSSRREVTNFRDGVRFPWDVAPFPTLEEPATVLHSDGLCVAKGPRADAARAFVSYATGDRGQRILARGGRTVPSLKAVAASPDFLDPTQKPRNARVFLDAIISGGMRRLPTTRNFTEVDDAARLALESAFYGRSSLDTALARIARETRGRFGDGQGGR